MYIPFDTEKDALTVEDERADTESLLNTVKTLIAVRKEHRSLQSFGKFIPLYAEKQQYPFIYERRMQGERIVVALNPADRTVRVPAPLEGKTLWSVGELPKNGQMSACSAVIISL